MLKKCLKYDLRETFKMWWPFMLAGTAAAGVTGLLFGIMMAFAEDSSYVALASLPAMLFYILTIICIFVATVVPYIRYYTHFFGKESYLTFTLPVKRSTLFTSKVLSGFLYTTLSTALPFALILGIVFLSSLAAAAEAPPTSGGILYMALFAAIMLVYLLFVIGMLLASLLGSYLIITFCGVHFKKYSLFIIIAAFYLLGNAGSILFYLPMLSGFFFVGGAVGLGNLGIISVGTIDSFLLVILALALLAVIMVLINLLLWVLNLELLERKLNVT